MKILVLHGPNLNLIGKLSTKEGTTITLGKIDTALKKKARQLRCELKTLQTHKNFSAINFIQRNRNWADGLIFTPMSWLRYEFSLLESLEIAQIKTIQIIFDGNYNTTGNGSNSIFDDYCFKTLTGKPTDIYTNALEELNKSK